MTYELFYSTGGHVGGFGTAFEAKMEALRRLNGHSNLDWIAVKTSSINGVEVARITRDDLCMVVDELGKTVPTVTATNNVAIFTVEAKVILAGVSDMELNNSEVLHPDVLEKLKADLAKITITNVGITLDEVYETKDGILERRR